jgi:hypothetical protein
MMDEVIPQKIRDEVSPELIPSHPSLIPNQTLPNMIGNGSHLQIMFAPDGRMINHVDDNSFGLFGSTIVF